MDASDLSASQTEFQVLFATIDQQQMAKFLAGRRLMHVLDEPRQMHRSHKYRHQKSTLRRTASRYSLHPDQTEDFRAARLLVPTRPTVHALAQASTLLQTFLLGDQGVSHKRLLHRDLSTNSKSLVRYGFESHLQ